MKFLDVDAGVPSSATDPLTPVTPEVASNGNILNLWTLNLRRRASCDSSRMRSGASSRRSSCRAAASREWHSSATTGQYPSRLRHEGASTRLRLPTLFTRTDHRPRLRSSTLITENQSRKRRFEEDVSSTAGRP